MFHHWIKNQLDSCYFLPSLRLLPSSQFEFLLAKQHKVKLIRSSRSDILSYIPYIEL